MRSAAKQSAISFFVGLVFAIGLGLAGMTNPGKIIAFLDPANWDPSLLFVMAGAVGVHAVLYPLVRRRSTPLLDPDWHVPTRRDLTPRLIVGSALFGIGWGVGGFCPGPGLTSIISGDLRALVFVGAMCVGMLSFIALERKLPIGK